MNKVKCKDCNHKNHSGDVYCRNCSGYLHEVSVNDNKENF